ncbi:hypothetical protein STEG23_033946, partial [Scotinomys teguina]
MVLGGIRKVIEQETLESKTASTSKPGQGTYGDMVRFGDDFPTPPSCNSQKKASKRQQPNTTKQDTIRRGKALIPKLNKAVNRRKESQVQTQFEETLCNDGVQSPCVFRGTLKPSPGYLAKFSIVG